MAYFLFRHLSDGVENGEVIEIILFSILSARIINFISQKYGHSFEEAARMYSAEIEYSDENKEAMLRFVEEYYVL